METKLLHLCNFGDSGPSSMAVILRKNYVLVYFVHAHANRDLQTTLVSASDIAEVEKVSLTTRPCMTYRSAGLMPAGIAEHGSCTMLQVGTRLKPSCPVSADVH